jgi:hypothetical protein
MSRELKHKWAKSFQPLVGRTIKSVRWMLDAEQKKLNWYHAPIVIQLDDGTLLYPSRDDEGNDAGALFVQAGRIIKDTPETAPVI